MAQAIITRRGGSGGGINTDSATATAADILLGKTAYAKDSLLTGIIPTKAAETITPSVANKTIAAGQYLEGTQTIAGDANLIPSNIASGKSIFGVAGSYAGAVKYANGRVGVYISNGKGTVTVSGLAFRPLAFYLYCYQTGSYYYWLLGAHDNGVSGLASVGTVTGSFSKISSSWTVTLTMNGAIPTSATGTWRASGV